MSTQAPQPPTPKGSRNNRRQSKKSTPHKVAHLSTPPSSPPRNMSPGITTDSSNPANSSKKKPPRSAKKQNGQIISPAPIYGHRHTNSQPSVNTPQLKDGAHYAGPTFHASPAPSALPIPSFFSKSVPDSDLATTLETDSDNAEMEPEIDTTPSKPRARPQPISEEQKPTPLDFLFKAAVQARNSSSASSPEVTNRIRSPQTDSKALHQPTPDGIPGGIFAFEMENADRKTPIGPSFAPSYQDRMNALRSSSSPSPSSAEFSDDQRRLKTQELKHLLLNPRPQKPPSTSPSIHNQPGSFGARPSVNSNVPHYVTPMRTASGPPATNGFSGQTQPLSHNAGRPPFAYTHSSGVQPPRNSNSPLRREVPASHSPHSAGIPAEGSPSPFAGNRYHPAFANAPQSKPSFASPQPQYPSASLKMPTKSPSPSGNMDTKKMEDDLRRILKLDAGPGIPSSGMQSSFV